MKNPIKLFKSVFKMDDNPERIAKGFALGAFIGMVPIPGFQVFVAFTIASIIRVNKRAACIAVFNTNLFTGPFIFAFNYWLGKKILGINSVFEMPEHITLHFVTTILHAGADVYLSLVAGGVITGVLSAVIGYYVVKYVIINRKARRLKT